MHGITREIVIEGIDGRALTDAEWDLIVAARAAAVAEVSISTYRCLRCTVPVDGCVQQSGVRVGPDQDVRRVVAE
ncbi:hypothetical protein [Mycolicibacterium sp.]|uniref:hypothetical protein n=1 Tax=Mycolicibacterium sp. TaxID=2320850 RepID=UPI003D10EB0F